MIQTIAILLKKNNNMEKIRKKYIPNYNNYLPHITLVYPFEIKNQKILDEHIKESIKQTKPFTLELKGLKKSAKEYYLYLLPKKGKKELMRLHKKLNSNLLNNFKNKDMPKYIPHLSVGIFKTKEEIDETIRVLKKEKLISKTKVDSIQLLTIGKTNKLVKIKSYQLK